MQGNALLAVTAFLPVLLAPAAYAVGRRRKGGATMTAAGVSAVTLAMLVWLLSRAAVGEAETLWWPGFCGLGLRMRADGFRALYACVAGLMWMVTSLFGRDYFAHEHRTERYALFSLITLGATVGLFLSDTLYSAFLFFEVMSLASYPWVAQEETPEAMRAAQTYLYVAVIGGLVMLMGLFLLPNGMAAAPYDQLPALAAQTQGLMLPALLVLFGFGAKAGAFPLHIWLPKAHPVAPAPASALLSGMLTKAGVLGMLVLSCYLMRGATAFADLIFRLGVITMALGAVLAIFSVNLKRTLACSSLSQIGFIMIGVGLVGLSNGENGLAAFGTVQHMVNHSLFKLVLFLCAGVVAMNAHALNLNDVRGFGRRKPVLHACFLAGMLGIAGVPLFSGYASKSMLHEGLLEYIAELGAQGLNAAPYQAAEWAFVLSGGMTLCYMLKLYLCLFWQKNPERQAEYDAMKSYLSPVSKVALGLCAALIVLLGVWPGVFMSALGQLALPFLGSEAPHHLPIAYFSAENLLGAAKSLGAGVVLFGINRLLLTPKRDGRVTYPDRWPKRLDLEELVYRPALSLLTIMGYGVVIVLDGLMDRAAALLCALGMALAHVLDVSMDCMGVAARRTVLSVRHARPPIPVGNRATYSLGRLLDGAVAVLNRTVRREKPIRTHFESVLAAGKEEAVEEFKRVTRSISFGLMMFALGLCFTLAYLLWR